MVARVVLKKAKTYTHNRRRWIKDVPRTIKGEEQIKSFQENGYFHVTILQAKSKSDTKKLVKPKRKAKKKVSTKSTNKKKSKLKK